MGGATPPCTALSRAEYKPFISFRKAFWMMLTTQLQPLQDGGNCLLNVQAIAGPSVRTVQGDSKMTSTVITDFKILNSTGKTSLLEVRIVSYRGHGRGRM